MRAIAVLAALMMLPAARLATVRAGEEGDRDKVQGTWTVSAGEKAGRKVPEEELKDITLTFTGGTVLWKAGGKETRGTFSLDATKSPREITMSADDHAAAGIYRLEGDELEICVGHGDDRPTGFATREGEKTMRLVLRRKRP